MSTDVKICGLTRAEDVRAAAWAGASYLGFIIGAPSPRAITPDHAAEITADVKTPTVAVTVNPDDALLTRIMATLAPDYIQLHGDETPDRVVGVARSHRVGVIKAMGIAEDADIVRAGEYSGFADFLLFDAKPPPGTDVRGGHGVAADWTVIARAPRPARWALAGGLDPDNVGAAMAATRPPIVDVSSGVEVGPGVKDAKIIRQFMDAVNG